MSSTFPLDRMSVEEKLRLMKSLWEDLIRTAGDLKSPKWHATVLNKRTASLEQGDDEFEAWDVAREKIEDEIR